LASSLDPDFPSQAALGFSSQKEKQKYKIMENSFSNSNQCGKRGVGFVLILAVALGSCVIIELRAQVVVVPNAVATNDGNASITAPANPGSARVMLLLDASQFGSLSGPSFLTQLARRADTIPGPSGPRTQILRVYASTTSRSVARMSTTFSQNIGTNNTLVFDGTVTVSTQNLPGPGNTRQFDIVTRLTSPFFYDPAAGNLLVEVQYFSDDGPSLQWDAVTTADPFVRTIIGPGSPTSPTGFFINSPVYQFTFESPPLVTIRASQVEVCWNSQSNLTYQVQYRSDLTTNLWNSLVDCIRSTNSMSCFYDPIAVGQPQRFYRVVLTNCVP
jgi:hypothetical protein